MGILLILVGLTTFTMTTSPARAEHYVGNGGDPLEVVVYEATDLAAQMLLGTSSETLLNLDADTRDWILQNRRSLAEDVLERSELHVWIEEAPWQTCMRTNVTLPDYNPEAIYLLREACHTEVLDTDVAAKLLVHETLHHFGILNEPRAIELSEIVFQAWRRSIDLSRERWESKPTFVEAPERRSYHTAVWAASRTNGGKMIVFGGCHESETSFVDCGIYLNNGGIYDQATNHWDPLPQTNAPDRRAWHSAVWTGATGDRRSENRMLIWGGCYGEDDACDVSLASGSMLALNEVDPRQSVWQEINSDSAPSPRVFHSAVWAGNEMIIWGGLSGYKDPTVPDHALADGSIYNPVTNNWHSLPPAPISGRREHTAIWTGNKMIVWGGCGDYADSVCEDYLSDGAVLEFVNGRPTWHKMAADLQNSWPEGRRGHSTVWTGRFLIVFGGEGRSGFLDSGAAYDPEIDTWQSLPNSLGPDRRGYHAAVWTGSSMLVWGGIDGVDSYPRQLGEFVPSTQGDGEWFISELARKPHGSRSPTAVWTGSGMLIWGGETSNYTYMNAGATYLPGRR